MFLMNKIDNDDVNIDRERRDIEETDERHS